MIEGCAHLKAHKSESSDALRVRGIHQAMRGKSVVFEFRAKHYNCLKDIE